MRLQRHGEVAGELEVAVDAEALDVPDEAQEVLVAEALQLRHLGGEAREAILDAVRERAEREAAVAPAGAEADRVRLEHDDVAGRIVRLRVERRPEPGEPAADDAEIGLGRPFELGLGLPRRQGVEPVGLDGRVSEGSALRVRWRARGPRKGHGRRVTAWGATARRPLPRCSR